MFWVIFVLALLASVLLHEAGHFLTAKRFGMKATQFFLGFGPTLWSFRRGETEYGVKAIPAGGFVKIVGMTQLEELDPVDEPRAFWRAPARQRFVVLVAGSTMHFLIAMVLVPIALFGFGDQRSTLRVGEIPPCVPIVELAKCGPNDAAAPAQGVLQVGDEIVAVGGKQVSQWLDVTRAIRAAGAGPLAITVRRDGQQLDLRPTLIEVERTDLDAPDATGKKTKVGALGISPATERVRPSVGTGLKDSGTQLWEDVKGTFLSLGKFPAAVPKAFSAAFSNKERDPNGFVGPVGIARISGQVAERSGVGRFLLLIAAFNIFIGIVNLLPLLPLDGGHVAVLLFEKARSAIARALGRKDPGRVDLRKLMPVATLVVALLATLTVLMLFADVNNPINLPG